MCLLQMVKCVWCRRWTRGRCTSLCRGDGVDGDAGIQLCLCAWPCPSRVEVMLLPRIMHRLSVVARLPADYAAQCQSA